MNGAQLCKWSSPPGWPVPSADWIPPAGWAPPTEWPAAPPGWQFWKPVPPRPKPRGFRRIGRWALRPVRMSNLSLLVTMVTFVFLLIAMVPLVERFVGDPSSVYITGLGREVDPKALILQECRASVRAIDGFDDTLRSDGRWVQRWRVDPVPGHVDRAFLDTESGAVTCP